MTLDAARGPLDPMPAWNTDVRHLVPAHDKSAPAAARRRAKFTRALVEAATSNLAALAWTTSVRCIARLGRKSCGAPIVIKYDGADKIAWSCAACGESGLIHGFLELPDVLLSLLAPMHLDPPRPSARKKVTWGLAPDEQKLLLGATTHLPDLHEIITSAKPHVELPGLLLVRATVDELDEIYSLVEALEDATRSHKRLELLGGLRFSLSTAMDGF